jgi:O-acetyl-ADP-ribose deacetylase (regulator of RNase III)
MFESGADCLINTVNCEGFMGKGIAYQFKMRFPENNLEYEHACRTGKLHIGTLHYHKEDEVLIVNFPTKDKWRENSRIEYVEKGLDQLVELLLKVKPSIIALPPLGCGNGGLDWIVVKQVILEKLSVIGDMFTFLIFEPSASYKVIPKQAPNLSVSGLVLLDIRLNLNKFNAIRLQKAGFFMNFFLEEEYFKFDKWKYGPYSHAIDIVSRSINEYQKHYGLTNSKDTYDQVYKIICSRNTEQKIEKLYPAIVKSTKFINKINSDKKLEGVATVLYILQKAGRISEDEIVVQFKKWSEDKANRFSKNYIIECINYLELTNIIATDIWGSYELAINALK